MASVEGATPLAPLIVPPHQHISVLEATHPAVIMWRTGPQSVG